MRALISIALMLGLLAGCNDRTPFALKCTSGTVTGYDYAFGYSSDLTFNFKAHKSGAYLIQAWEGQPRCGDKLVFQTDFFANEDEKKVVTLDHWNGQPCKKVYRIDVIWSDGYNIDLLDTVVIEDNESN